jgi:protein-S-isoprenylcysteine O-methyltransferase Ste14
MPPESPSEKSGSKATGSLVLSVDQIADAAVRPRFTRELALRLCEVAILLVAVVGAVATGLGITAYFADHLYVAAYLVAFGGFRVADLMIRDDPDAAELASVELRARMASQIPLLAMFAGAPFERTYIYGGPAPSWSAALGLLIAVSGMWMALGARVQLAFFGPGRADRPTLVRSGFYRHLRHPTFSGVFLMLVGWPMIFGAGITLIVTVVVFALEARRKIVAEERQLIRTFGEEYEAYMRETDAMIPNVW